MTFSAYDLKNVHLTLLSQLSKVAINSGRYRYQSQLFDSMNAIFAPKKQTIHSFKHEQTYFASELFNKWQKQCYNAKNNLM